MDDDSPLEFGAAGKEAVLHLAVAEVALDAEDVVGEVAVGEARQTLEVERDDRMALHERDGEDTTGVAPAKLVAEVHTTVSELEDKSEVGGFEFHKTEGDLVFIKVKSNLLRVMYRAQQGEE
jgi:hypothetical protein